MKTRLRLEEVVKAYLKDAASSGSARGRTRDSATEQAGVSSRRPSPGSGTIQIGVDAQIPMPLKSGRLAALHDIGTHCIVEPVDSPELDEGAHVLADLEDFIRDNQNTHVHLSRSLLVRIDVEQPSGEIVQILCVSQDIGCTGITLMLPCRLDLHPGARLDMELFLPSSDVPAPAHGVIRRIRRMTGEDTVRYAVEIDFGSLSRTVSREVAAFVYASCMEERKPMLA